jgi:MoaE protein
MNFDLRLPIGIIFSFYGLLLLIYGIAGDKEQYARSLGININVVWGIVMLVFGGFMLLLARKSFKNRNDSGEKRWDQQTGDLPVPVGAHSHHPCSSPSSPAQSLNTVAEEALAVDAAARRCSFIPVWATDRNLLFWRCAVQPSLWVEVIAPHRGEAFAACQWLIDEMKRVVPIWKKPVGGWIA